MKTWCTLLLMLMTCWLSAQSVLWRDIVKEEVRPAAGAEVELPLTDYRTVAIDLAAVQTRLRTAPVEGSVSARTTPVLINLPLPDGGNVTFRAEESSVLHPDLQARYPQIRSYRIVGDRQGAVSGRLSVTQLGIVGVIHTPEGDAFIEPYTRLENRDHVVYWEKDVAAEAMSFRCGASAHHSHHLAESSLPPTGVNFRGPLAEVSVRVYRMALASTGEFARLFSSSKPNVLAAFNNAITILNDLYLREVAIRFELIADNDKLAWIDPATDPYINANMGGQLLSQQLNAIVTVAGIPYNAFDIGHVFTGNCDDVGGVANSARVCQEGKERGVSCFSSTNIAAITRRVMAHEVGHQFSAQHTFSNCQGEEGQTSTGTAYEPGSGSTIMSYAGGCGTENIQNTQDDYFHVNSLQAIIGYSRNGVGNTCPTIVPTGNNEPVLTLDYTNGFYIPISTPFELIADATDPDGDQVLYCWEQYDLGPQSIRGMPLGDAPAFRSFPPRPEPNRVFPRIEVILAAGMDASEVLPTYSRNLTFRCTARDNDNSGGGTVWQQVAFKATSTAGPFLVLSPNTSDVVWNVGSYEEVTWDVANTDNELVNAKTVDIRLSTDGGRTYPITLAEGAPNTGRAYVTVPEALGDRNRIRIQGSNNIFFDISDANFTIEPAAEPTYTLEADLLFDQLCLPAAVQVNFTTSAVLGYSEPITLSVKEGLPEGATTSFSPSTINPGQSSTLTIGLEDVRFTGDLTVVVQAVSGQQDTFLREILLRVVDTDFSGFALTSPSDGTDTIQLSTDFSWTGVVNAETYDFQLATNPAFGDSTLIDISGLNQPAYIPEILFENGELYFWRVRPVNECGIGDWTEPFTFHTISTTCSPLTSTDTPINIPGTGPPPTRESTIFVPFDGVISDVNIPLARIRYSPVRNMEISLIGPDNTEALLFDQQCGNTNFLDMGFDDEAPFDIACPPNTGLVAKPFEPLAKFVGKNSAGNWKLRVKIITNGNGNGSLEEWRLEFCARSVAQSPAVLVNDTLLVRRGLANWVSNTELSITDPDNAADDLRFTIVSLPEHGQLVFGDDVLEAGEQFTQSSIDGFSVYYRHDGGDADFDHFTFVVEDGTGGFLPVQTFNIRVDESAPVNTNDRADDGLRFRLFPNPTSSEVRLALNQPLPTAMPVRIFNLQGQVLHTAALRAGDVEWRYDASELPAGIYFVQVGVRTERLVRN